MSSPRAIADTLIAAERDRTPIAPFTRKFPFLDVQTAYAAQTLFVEHRLQAGEQLIGTKMGMTSGVKRTALDIHEPVFGRLTSGMVVPHGEVVHLGELIAARAEPEIALLMAQRVQAPTTIAAVVLGFAQPRSAQTTTRAANESATDNQGKGT